VLKPAIDSETEHINHDLRPPKGELAASFVHAWAGLRYVFCSERNPRIYFGVSVLVTAIGIWLELSRAEWALIIAAIAFVFAAEMLNTVVELVVDLITREQHPLAKKAKDVAAGSVLVAALAAAAVGVVVLGPPLWDKLASLLA